jgi:hypothetical protein
MVVEEHARVLQRHKIRQTMEVQLEIKRRIFRNKRHDGEGEAEQRRVEGGAPFA